MEYILNLLSNNAVVAAFVSALVSGIVSVIAFAIKNSNEKHKTYNEISRKRLESVVNILIYDLKQVDLKKGKIDEETKSILREKGNLLSTEIYMNFMDLIEIERHLNNNLEMKMKEIQLGKFGVLHEQISTKLIIEQKKLLKVQNENFEKYVESRNALLDIRISETLIKCSEFIFFTSIILGGAIYIVIGLWNVTSPEDKTNFPLIVLATIVIMIVLLGFIFGSLSIIMKIINPFYKTFHVSKHVFRHYSPVKQTGVYKCQICGKESIQYNGTDFTYCDHKGSKNKLSKYFSTYYWKLIEQII
ncbi:MAG: hypothetical protein K8R73_07340 [Clostridiales bacterium]|nr:hypothetical protein [Clostridiales bacterium]